MGASWNPKFCVRKTYCAAADVILLVLPVGHYFHLSLLHLVSNSSIVYTYILTFSTELLQSVAWEYDVKISLTSKNKETLHELIRSLATNDHLF